MADTISTIVMPTDGSKGALKAVRLAAQLARATGATLSLVIVHSLDVYAFNSVGQLTWLGGTEFGGLTKEEVDAMVQRNVAAPAFNAARQVIGEGVEVRTRELWGQAAEEICRHAAEEHADLIVIGSRGRSIFGELVLGSVSSQVLHHAACPVCVVR